ncbi:hypothetical protein EJB05_47687, partial [Eragrostis curvula]
MRNWEDGCRRPTAFQGHTAHPASSRPTPPPPAGTPHTQPCSSAASPCSNPSRFGASAATSTLRHGPTPPPCRPSPPAPSRGRGSRAAARGRNAAAGSTCGRPPDAVRFAPAPSRRRLLRPGHHGGFRSDPRYTMEADSSTAAAAPAPVAAAPPAPAGRRAGARQPKAAVPTDGKEKGRLGLGHNMKKSTASASRATPPVPSTVPTRADPVEILIDLEPPPPHPRSAAALAWPSPVPPLPAGAQPRPGRPRGSPGKQRPSDAVRVAPSHHNTAPLCVDAICFALATTTASAPTRDTPWRLIPLLLQLPPRLRLLLPLQLAVVLVRDHPSTPRLLSPPDGKEKGQKTLCLGRNAKKSTASTSRTTPPPRQSTSLSKNQMDDVAAAALASPWSLLVAWVPYRAAERLNALNRDMRFANLHSDSGDLRKLLQRACCDGVSHRFQKIMRRAFNNTLSYPAERGPKKNKNTWLMVSAMLSDSPAAARSIQASMSTTNFWPSVCSSCFTPWNPWNCSPRRMSLSPSPPPPPSIPSSTFRAVVGPTERR